MKAHPARKAASQQRRWKKYNFEQVLAPDPIIDQSPAQKQMRVNKASLELADLGYSVVPTEWLRFIISTKLAAAHSDPRWKLAIERGAVLA